MGTMWEPSDVPWDDSVRVCYKHGKINACRAPVMADCMWTINPAKVEAVVAYQTGHRDTWQVGQEWYPGMPCNACGTKDTYLSDDPTIGAYCRGCGAHDDDE